MVTRQKQMEELVKYLDNDTKYEGENYISDALMKAGIKS
jgi:hypothetical protein